MEKTSRASTVSTIVHVVARPALQNRRAIKGHDDDFNRQDLILHFVADGSVTLTTVAMLRPHLADANHESLLGAARHKTKREVELLIATLAPRPDAKALIRRLPTQREAQAVVADRAGLVDGSTASSSEALVAPAADATSKACAVHLAAPPPAPISRVSPLASDRYLLRVTLSASGHANLRRAQELMAHRAPNGDPSVIIAKALSLLVAELERTKVASVRRPRAQREAPSPSSSGSRHIPAIIRRRVWARDEGRCAFVGSCGRCTETSRLEFHHLIPFARGGATTLGNIALRCRSHNAYESELAFGHPQRSGSAALGGWKHAQD